MSLYVHVVVDFSCDAVTQLPCHLFKKALLHNSAARPCHKFMHICLAYCHATLVHTNFWLRKFVTLHCSSAFLSSDYFCYATVSLENAPHFDAAC